MRPVWGREASRAADRGVIEGLGVPGIALMELASKGVAEAIRTHLPAEAARGVVVACGPGNNGGDGWGAARWLHRWGFPVAVLPLAHDASGDAAVEREAALRAGVPTTDVLGRPGVVVDALFGTGLTRPLEGRAAELVRAMDASGAAVVAVDLPSGLHADTGAVLGVAPTAVLTVTPGGPKPGMFTGEGPRRCGRVEVVDIGLDPSTRDAEVPDAEDLARVWPWRPRDAHKNRSGHLLVIAGSTAMAGAAVLTCRGALAAGAGLVTLLAPRGALPRLAALPPEVMVLALDDGDVFDGTLPDLGRFSAVAAGPGLRGHLDGPTGAARAAVGSLWATCPLPVVCDADALSDVGADPGGAPRVVTPHPGEAARMLGTTAAEVQADRFGAVRRLARPGVVALLKGACTLVAEAGRPVSINPVASAVLGTGGSGDVLTGVVGALLARGATAWDAARLAAWVHGTAGLLLERRRVEGWTAGDIAAAVPEAIGALRATTGSALPRPDGADEPSDGA